MEADGIKLNLFMIIIYIIIFSFKTRNMCKKRGEGGPTLLKHKLRAVSKNLMFTKTLFQCIERNKMNTVNIY